MTENNPDGSPTAEGNALIVGQGPDGQMYVVAAESEGGDEAITEPGKVMRIGRMISRLLDEVKDAPLDDASRARLRAIYAQSIDELAGGLDENLGKELRRITTPFAEATTPSDAELRIAQAQLVGWLEGLFQGLQTAMVAQHLSARLNEGARGAIPPPNHPVADAASPMNSGLYL